VAIPASNTPQQLTNLRVVGNSSRNHTGESVVAVSLIGTTASYDPHQPVLADTVIAPDAEKRDDWRGFTMLFPEVIAQPNSI